MTRFLSHVKSNAIAYLALFIALGGTSYAAVTLPAGSVGARQIKNHSIAPVKFDPTAIGGSVRDWAVVTFVNSEPVLLHSSSRASVRRHGVGVVVQWSKPFSAQCSAIATIRETGFEALPPEGFASAGVEGPGGAAFVTSLNPTNSALLPFTVAVLC